jgi:N-acetylneuraminic acid mutarotase
MDVQFSARVSSNLLAWPSNVNSVIGPLVVGETTDTVTEKFRCTAPVMAASRSFLQVFATHTGVRNSWETNAPMPVALDEVSCGIIGGRLYVVGGGSPATLAFDLTTSQWTNLNAPRPFPGNHHAAETFNGRLYLLGGIGGDSPSHVQIYNPALNTWSVGANMPYPAGSGGSALINGEIYIAGGIINGVTINNVACYNPLLNTWTTNLASMPLARNHAAAATDGSLLYVFGGRPPADGSDTVQIYNPATDRWTSSSFPGSTLSPLPQIRGGMGKAVFFNGEFYIMGGETFTGSGATPQRVYNRVDIYSPVSNAWREGAPMLTARHGIYPVLDDIRIYVAGGGVVAGASSSSLLEVYITP